MQCGNGENDIKKQLPNNFYYFVSFFFLKTVKFPRQGWRGA
jgi:hypothetical protein